MSSPLMPLRAVARRSRLLVVEDEPITAEVLYDALSDEHEVLMATSGEPALALVRDKAPDAVLLDVTLPGIDGFEVCRRLKADALTRDIPVIFITAHDDLDIEAHGLECGAVDFFTKPIHPRMLLARVKVHVTLKQHTDVLRGLVYIDGLTGLCNRRGFDERLITEWQRAQRSGQWLALMLIDVDHFKLYNDQHGHQAGDDCLRAIAGALVETTRRPADLVARYGGEEFAAILPETAVEGAKAMAQRLQAKVRELSVLHGAQAAAPIVTVSIGGAVARWRQGVSIAEFLAVADHQLYRAKAAGRDLSLVAVV